MDFLKILKDMVDGVEGGSFGTIMGFDGISIQNYTRGGGSYDIDTFGVEYSKVLSEIKKASEVLKLGELEEVSINSEVTKILLKLLSREYFIALVLTGKANTGKAKFLLRRAARLTGREFLR